MQFYEPNWKKNRIGKLIDVKGAFLHGEFGPKEEPILMKVPQGMEKYYPKNWLILLLKTIYGLKQAARDFNLHLK